LTDKGDVVPLSAHPFHPEGRTRSHSGHLNWIVLWPQQKTGV